MIAVQEMGKQQWAPWLTIGAEKQIVDEIGETLVKINPETGEKEPGLAESWTIDPSNGTWDIKLRPDIPFQDGWGTVTADDVKFSWEQYIIKDSNQSGVASYRNAIDNDMNNFEIVSPLEFKLHTTHPVLDLPDALSDLAPGLIVQSKKYWDEKPDEALSHPIGTGPYKFVSSTRGVEVRLEAVPDHWHRTATFKTIVFRIIPDDAARLAAVASGAVDVATISPSLIREAQAMGIRSLAIPDTSNWGLMFGGWYVGDSENYTPDAPWIQAKDPAKGLAVRQAMSLAFNRQAIIDKVFNGQGSITHVPFFEYPKSSPMTTDPSWPLPQFDVDKAKQLLAEGGYPNGFDVTVPIYDRADKAGTLDMNNVVADSLEAIGLKVNRMVADYAGTVSPAIRARKTQGWVYPVPISGGDPLRVLGDNFQVSAPLLRFSDPVIDAALAKMKGEYDVTKRYAALREVEASMVQNLIGGIPLVLTNNALLVGPKVGGWEPVPGLAQITNLETMTAAP